ncbi:hypothetical protein [Alloactinosynnema sp. L-07]|nr:hypothetical protein [Alloactinosynnema sp. L-07]
MIRRQRKQFVGREPSNKEAAARSTGPYRRRMNERATGIEPA